MGWDIPASTAITAQSITRFTDSIALLGGAGVFTGTSRATTGVSRFRAKAVSDQAGTLLIDQSVDGITWDNTISQPVPAATPTEIESITNDGFTRVRYVNGGVAQGSFRLSSALVQI